MGSSKLHIFAVLTVSIVNFSIFTCHVNAANFPLRGNDTEDSPSSLIEFLWKKSHQNSDASIVANQTSSPQIAYKPVASEVAFETVADDQVTQTAFNEIAISEVFASETTSGYGWELFPEGLLYHSYMAGEKEPRFASQWLWERERGRIWEAAVGGRWGVFRKGTPGPNGQGFQFDVEGGALVRIDPESEDDLEAADFRGGFIGTWRDGPLRWKTGYYHLSSHVGDEFLIRNPMFDRKNYVRDALLVGVTYDVNPELSIYGEYAYAANANGGAEPGEIQLGVQYSALEPVWLQGAPFFAINGHLREEYDFGGSVNILAGWQWIGPRSDHSFRFGFQHYNGPSMQYSFVNQYESLTGFGIWFDY